jgi:hypothetical protein
MTTFLENAVGSTCVQVILRKSGNMIQSKLHYYCKLVCFILSLLERVV